MHRIKVKVDWNKKAVAKIFDKIDEGMWDAAKFAEKRAKEIQKPHIDTGKLNKSIKGTYNKKTKTITLGSRVKYAFYHEFGTAHHQAFPYIRPALDATMSKLIAILKKRMK